MGGSVVSTYHLSKHLAKRGHDVTIFTTDFQLNRKYIDGLVGVRVVPFHCIANIGMMLYSPKMKKQLKGEIKNFDIIHMHNFRSYQNIISHNFAIKYKIPYVLQPRGSIPRLSKSKQKKLFDIFFGRAIVKDADEIIATSRIESDQYVDVFPDMDNQKIIHIPNGIDLETYQNLPKRGNLRRKYSINTNEKIILFLSRIHERKGADILIEAFYNLKRELENIKLIIAGPDDGYLDILKWMVKKLNINDDVLFPGPLYGKEKLEAYVDADVFVLPSKNRYESFGNVVLEACACGTPIIVTNNCGVAEWISNNVSYVIEYDKDQLHDAIFRALSDDGLRRKFGMDEKRLVREKFGWDKVVRKVEEFYEDCNV